MFDPWAGKTPPEKEVQPTLLFLPGKFLDQGAWRAAVHEVLKSQTQLNTHTHAHTSKTKSTGIYISDFFFKH